MVENGIEIVNLLKLDYSKAAKIDLEKAHGLDLVEERRKYIAEEMKRENNK